MKRGAFIDRASRDEILKYQEKALGDVLRRAVAMVPAYYHLRGLVERLPAREALKGFPLISKADLQSNLRRYLPTNFDRIAHVASTTGGTTGEQFTFFVDDQSQAVETAFMHRQWARVGYSPTQRKATFRGVQFTRMAAGEYWQANPIYNEVQFSPFHMAPTTFPAYAAAIRRYNPAFIHGYPSAVYMLAQYILSCSDSVGGPKVKAALLGSEGLEALQREAIERAFACRAFTWYGHSERVILAGECEYESAYHSFPDYGVLEIIAEDREQAVEEECRGEIVGTGLLNKAMPLIRYRTGDFARLLPSSCRCGRHFDRFDRVSGRWRQEFVIGKTGARMSLAALNVHGDAFKRVVRYQYFQDRPGALDIRVVANVGFGPEDVREITRAFTAKVGTELTIGVREVESIALTKRGKVPRLIQAIPADVLKQ